MGYPLHTPDIVIILISKLNKMAQQEIERRIKMLHWFIDGIGIHGIDWSLYKALTPDWVTKNYNAEI